MTVQEINNMFSAFKGMSVMIIGDVMIDAYYRGKVDRISPEAPVPVVHVTSSEKRLGGAANVARNVASLGAEPILCSVIGKDLSGADFLEVMKQESMDDRGVLMSEGRQTTVKTRVISGSQQMLRVDEERIAELSEEEFHAFLQRVLSIIESTEVDVIIFEDYDKGLLSAELIKAIVEKASEHKIPVCADPKKVNFLNYHNIDLFKPNLKELREGLNVEIDKSDLRSLSVADEKLREALGHRMSLITLSEEGVYISWPGGSKHINAHRRNIADVSGAGDTVIAVAAMCLAFGAKPEVIAEISNLAGGLVCEEVGVVPIDEENLLEESLSIFSE